jgi:glycosyltransferase involved in cell wall biosynthesis
MKKVSVIIPVFNALNSFKETLHSVIDMSDHLFELVIVDDHSDLETQVFINSLQLHESLNVRVTKTRNPHHSWTNASWNMGVRLATGDFIAVLNSDITLSHHWDTELIRMLEKKHCSIACPMELSQGKHVTLDPVIQKVDPHMIKGACFMFRRQETKKLFPIPPELTHWCGDNYLADRASEGKGVAFCAGAVISHAITQSGKLIDRETYQEVTRNDVLAYQALSGRDMSLVLKHMG